MMKTFVIDDIFGITQLLMEQRYRPEDNYIGCFSDSGHYILLIGAEGEKVRVLDPMYRPGRFDIPGRTGKVKMEGSVAEADFAVVAADCYHRPFFLFEKEARHD